MFYGYALVRAEDMSNNFIGAAIKHARLVRQLPCVCLPVLPSLPWVALLATDEALLALLHLALVICTLPLYKPSLFGYYAKQVPEDKLREELKEVHMEEDNLSAF